LASLFAQRVYQRIRGGASGFQPENLAFFSSARMEFTAAVAASAVTCLYAEAWDRFD
jgi:hypothetical protein